MKGWMITAAAVVLAATPAAAQLEPSGAPCQGQLATTRCSLALQALASAAPAFGIVAAGGNPMPGVEGTRGVTLNLVPKTSASLRVRAARVHLPDLGAPPQGERSLAPVAVELGTATRLHEGQATGFGALDLLLEGGILTGTGEGGRTAAVLGVGGRVALLRESFAAPGAALSGMFRHVGPLRYGESCMIPACGAGVGQTDFGVDDFSARLTVGKRVGPVGLLGGAGWDRFATTHGRIAYLGGDGFEPVAATAAADVHDSRWSAFVNVSRNLLVASAVAEVGWMSGGSAVDGYTSGAEGFDPGQGTLFGSIALRVQL